MAEVIPVCDAPKAKGTKGQLRGSSDGGISGGYKTIPPEKNTPTLASLGISKRDAPARLEDTVQRWAWRVVVDGCGDVITPAEAISLADAIPPDDWHVEDTDGLDYIEAGRVFWHAAGVLRWLEDNAAA